MAVLHRKEEKIQAVLGRLPKKYTQEQFIEMFIKLYSKDWGKIKSAYIKQSQDKEPGTIINMPKPDVYLKQILATYIQQTETVNEAEPPKQAESVAAVKTRKVVTKTIKETELPKQEKPAAAKAKQAIAKPAKETEATETAIVEAKKPKAAAKKKVAVIDETVEKPKKAKATAKAKATETPAEAPKTKAVRKKAEK